MCVFFLVLNLYKNVNYLIFNAKKINNFFLPSAIRGKTMTPTSGLFFCKDFFFLFEPLGAFLYKRNNFLIGSDTL